MCRKPDLVTFNEEILNGKLHFLCSVSFHQVATYFTRAPEDTIGHDIIIRSNSSFTFNDNVFSLIILPRFFNRGWYITTNDTPCLPLLFLFVL